MLCVLAIVTENDYREAIVTMMNGMSILITPITIGLGHSGEVLCIRLVGPSSTSPSPRSLAISRCNIRFCGFELPWLYHKQRSSTSPGRRVIKSVSWFSRALRHLNVTIIDQATDLLYRRETSASSRLLTHVGGQGVNV